MKDLFPLQFILGPGNEEDAQEQAKYHTWRGWNWKKVHKDYGINSVVGLLEEGGWLTLCDDQKTHDLALAWRKRNLGY
jgi:hypothetical protein